MKILVTGSSGFVGRYVIKALVEDGAEPVGFDVVPPPARWTIPDVPFVQGSMENLDQVMAALIDHKVQRVLALGYVVAPLLSPDYRDCLKAVKVNVLGITNVFEGARLTGADRVIFASSIGVYGLQRSYGSAPITEETPMAATAGLYSLMKQLNGAIAAQYARVYNLRSITVYPAAIIGAGNTAFSARMIQAPALGRPGYANFPSGSRRNLVGVSDIAALYTRMALAPQVQHNAYLATGYSPTGRELAAVVRKYLSEAEIAFDESGHVGAWNFDNSRAVWEFGWKLHTLEETVSSEINGTRAEAGLPPV